MRATIGSSRIQCVYATDKIDCMELVRTDKADLVKAAAEDIYTAGYEYGLAPFVMEEVSINSYEYKSAAVVLRSSPVRSLRSLKGIRACMDRCVGPGRAGPRASDTGWHVPVTVLLERRAMESDCNGEDFTVARFFNSSCVPGSWSSSPAVDEILKSKFPSLCAQCKDSDSCSSMLSSTEAPPGGCERGSALDCLSDGRGDVAFVDAQEVGEFLRRRPDQRGNLEFLCLDGTRRPLMEVQDVNLHGCVWNQRPTAVFMGDSEKLRSRFNYERILRQAFQNHRVRPPSWFRRILVSSEFVTDLLPVPDHRDSWGLYLGAYRVPLEKELPNCELTFIRLCVWKDADIVRCEKWSKAAFPRHIRPRLRCERRSTVEECVEAVADSVADIVILPAGDAYRQAKGKKLRLLAVEAYDDTATEEEGDQAEPFNGAYAVAVIKTSSDIKNIDDLRGKSSCHSGISDLAGWAMPLSVMLEKGTLNELDCDRTEAISNFFTSGSCVPGAANESALCVHCRSDDESFSCDRKSSKYAGDEGALLCLSEDKGDVAFIRHWAAEDLSVPGSRRQYNHGYRSSRPTSSYGLLCPPQEMEEGNLQTPNKDKNMVAPLSDFRNCHWGKVPPSYVMISSKASREVHLRAAEFLADSSKTFSRGSDNELTFRLFGASLFNRTTAQGFFARSSGLRILPFQASYREAMDPKVLQIVEAADSDQCINKITDGASVCVVVPYLLIVLAVWVTNPVLERIHLFA